MTAAADETRSISEPRARVKYVSLAESGGYGSSAISYLDGLRKAGVPLTWTPLFAGAPTYRAARSREEALGRLAGLDLPPEAAALESILMDGQEGDVCVLHTIPELWPGHRQSRGRNIGYSVWETTNLPPHWPALCSSVDRLLTPSRFSAEVFEAAGIKVPIDVLPHTHRAPAPLADRQRFRTLHRIPDDHTVFYSINAWNARKAVWRTIHAYCAAFSEDDQTTLVIKTDAAGPAHEGDGQHHPVHHLVRDLISNYPDAPHVCLITREMPRHEIDDLHAAGDCYVSLTHAEGFGLGAFDAGCAGKPVVMTGWGGQLDYLSSEDAYLLDYELIPVINRLGAGSYRPDQLWAQASLDDAIERLRWVHEHRTEAAAAGARLGRRLRTEFDQRAVVDRLIRILNV